MTAELQKGNNEQLFPSDKLALFREATRGLRRTELGRIGKNIPVMYAGWGDHLSTDEMITKWGEGASESTKGVIRSYGVSGGYFDGDDHDPKSEEAHKRSVNNMVSMAEGMMRLRGWDHAVLRLSTISEHPDIMKEVVARLEEKGLRIDEAQIYGLACDGGGGAIIDAVADEKCNGKQMVCVAAENLSGESVPRKEVAMSTLFGNGGGAIAFIPGIEIKLADPYDPFVVAVVKRDQKGVIQIPRVVEMNELQKYYSPAKVPPWYQVEDDTHFLYSEGAVMNEMTTAGKLSAMDGRKTGITFKDLILPLVTMLLAHYHERDYERGSDKLELAILHQPSRTIFENIKKNLKQFFGIDCPNTPWFMEGTGFNNISSGNIFIALTEAARQNLFKPEEVFLLATFGIGLSAHAAILQLGE